MSDGIDCINIYSKGQTALGRALSNWYHCRIIINLGHFRTIEGLIFFLGSFDDELRYTNGFQSKRIGEQLDRGIRLPEDVFRKIIVEAMWAKIEKDAYLKESLKNSDLPLTHYYNYNGKKIFVEKWNWQVEEWEKIRKVLKNAK